MIDHYLWGSCERISPEAPVQVVDIKNETTVLGGAGNVLSNLVSLGAKVSVASVVGEDENGSALREKLNAMSVGCEGLIYQSGRKTSKKSRVMASHQQVVRFDAESKELISKESEKSLFACISKMIENMDAILLSDYGKGVLTPTLCQNIIKLARVHKIPCLVDPKGKDYTKYKNATLITPNKQEASLATNIDICDDSSLLKAGGKLRDELDLDIVIITLSEDGMAIFDESMEKIPTVAREVYDVTGAGDTVLASLGFALGCKLNIKEAALFATSAAGVVVGKLGSATTTLEEIARYEKQQFAPTLESKILTGEELKDILQLHTCDTIVFTNGCFDILHAGHVRYLERAKSFGSLLIVGLNSDSSVKNLKGPSRPINPQNDRAFVLAGLSFVDYVVVFEESTPYRLIKDLSPDILVKGADYEGKDIVGSDLVKETRLVEFLEGRSTSKIIEKARE
ncbi:MAG: D-glycero-beta-D-manno-heptose-7-phosphate kinase [Campylobacteraceae bacterium]|nr:D-glycero-beta-D-manno-heptose-7-phosphate kinase [Campylobacteraceae bacterium]